MKAHERWKYIEAVFVPPEGFTAKPSAGIPANQWVIGVPHPLWSVPIGKQLRAENRSTEGFLVMLRLFRARCWIDQLIHGTYQWSDDAENWELLTETGISGLALRCPETLPGDIEVFECGER